MEVKGVRSEKMIFFKKIVGTFVCPFVGQLIPVSTSGDVFSGCQSQSGQRYMCYMSPKIHLWSTPLLVYNASIAASHLPHMHVSAEVGCWDLNRRSPAWQSDVLTTRFLAALNSK